MKAAKRKITKTDKLMIPLTYSPNSLARYVAIANDWANTLPSTSNVGVCPKGVSVDRKIAMLLESFIITNKCSS